MFEKRGGEKKKRIKGGLAPETPTSKAEKQTDALRTRRTQQPKASQTHKANPQQNDDTD